MIYPMNFTWRCCFFFLFALGAIAAIYCGLALAGFDFAPEGKKVGRAEAIAGVVVGVLLLPFAITALRHARVELTDQELRYLGFGFLCRTRAISLEEIERFGVGHQKGSGGGREHLLYVELRDGYRRSIKLSMYDKWKDLVSQLEEKTGKTRSEMELKLTGNHFVDEEDRGGS